MALIYRAVFDTPDADPHDLVRAAFPAWLADRGARSVAIALPDAGDVDIGQGMRVRVVHAGDADVSVTQLELQEVREDDRVATSVTALTGPDARHVWVELVRDVDDAYAARIDLRAPKLTTEIMRRTVCLAGAIEIHPGFRWVEAGQASLVATLIHHPERPIPLVVLSPLAEDDDSTLQERAWETYVRCAGIATVVALRRDAVDVFNDHVGEDLRVYGGAIRTYLPIRSGFETHPMRHRFVTTQRVRALMPGDAARAAVAQIVQRGTERARPSLWDTRGREIVLRARGGARDVDALLADLLSAEERAGDLENEVRELEEQREFAYAERDEALTELDDASRTATYLRAALRKLDAEPAPPDDVPDVPPASFAEVIERAANLPGVRVGDDARQSAAALDARPGFDPGRAWLALRALSDYACHTASGEFSGNFLEYCKRPTGEPWFAHHVAMRESQTVEQSPRLRQQREFRCDYDLDDSGRIIMFSHLQIKRGGGDPPRLYFCDDTRGATASVHVGYLGPHLENASTN
jgi:hypothetical protein